MIKRKNSGFVLIPLDEKGKEAINRVEEIPAKLVKINSAETSISKEDKPPFEICGSIEISLSKEDLNRMNEDLFEKDNSLLCENIEKERRIIKEIWKARNNLKVIMLNREDRLKIKKTTRCSDRIIQQVEIERLPFVTDLSKGIVVVSFSKNQFITIRRHLADELKVEMEDIDMKKVYSFLDFTENISDKDIIKYLPFEYTLFRKRNPLLHPAIVGLDMTLEGFSKEFVEKNNLKLNVDYKINTNAITNIDCYTFKKAAIYKYIAESDEKEV